LLRGDWRVNNDFDFFLFLVVVLVVAPRYHTVLWGGEGRSL
jgi:hypothetical protein